MASTVGLALLSSVCCAAPLFAVAAFFGVSASSLGFLSSIKPYLLGGSLFFLGLALGRGFTGKKAACCGGGTSLSSKRLDTGAAKSLWLMAAVTVAVLVLPYITGVRAEVKGNSTAVTGVTESKISFTVKGMSQQCCVALITKALDGVSGYQRSEAYVSTLRLDVWFDPAKTSAAEIEKAVDSTYYEATPIN